MPMTDLSRYPHLAKIQVPADLRTFADDDLPAVADELRGYLIEAVASSGGHFGAGLGVMILDIAAGSLLASLVPHRMRARVSGAFRTVNYGIRPVGALIGGALGTAFGVRPTLWLATVGALLGVFWLVGSPIVRLRTLPEPPP